MNLWYHQSQTENWKDRYYLLKHWKSDSKGIRTNINNTITINSQISWWAIVIFTTLMKVISLLVFGLINIHGTTNLNKWENSSPQTKTYVLITPNFCFIWFRLSDLGCLTTPSFGLWSEVTCLLHLLHGCRLIPLCHQIHCPFPLASN